MVLYLWQMGRSLLVSGISHMIAANYILASSEEGAVSFMNSPSVSVSILTYQLQMLSSHRCVYGSEPIPSEQKRAKMAYSGTSFREHLHPLFHFGRLCEVCTNVYP